MPYYISKDSNLTGCPSWAVLKDDGETVACHATKADAIAQMVAISISEKMPVGGEWEKRKQ